MITVNVFHLDISMHQKFLMDQKKRSKRMRRRRRLLKNLKKGVLKEELRQTAVSQKMKRSLVMKKLKEDVFFSVKNCFPERRSRYGNML